MTSLFQTSHSLLLTFLAPIGLLAQETTDYAQPAAPSPVALGLSGLVTILMIAAMWKIFSKAGQPGWASLIPIYNYIVWCKIVGRPLWWVLLLFVCFPIAYIVLSIDLAKSFGKGAGFGVGIILLPFIFMPMLGFGSATYQGPAAAPRTA
jgi:hypothetical protein